MLPTMSILLLLAVGLAVNPRRWPQILGIALMVVLPWWASLAGLSALLVRHYVRRVDPQEEVAFLQAVAAELRAGKSLRQALVRGCSRAPGLDLARMSRLARAGRPMEEVAAAAGQALPGTGRLAEAAVRIGSESGGRVAPVFAALAGIQADRIDLSREIAGATAAARASMFVLAVLPLGGLVLVAATGRLSSLLEQGGPGLAMAVLGLLMLLSGIASVIWLGRGVSQ